MRPWLDWARELQAIAQTGLAYVQDPFDRERYAAVRRIAAEMMAAGSGSDPAIVETLFAEQAGHATPKVDVRGAVFEDGRILLVRERADGGWTLPGGWVDIHEPPSRAVEREVREESGYTVAARKLLALWDRERHDHPPHAFHIYKLFFLCELIGGAASSSSETDEVGFFAPDSLPPLSLSRVTPAQIGRLFEHLYHPDWPTDFD